MEEAYFFFEDVGNVVLCSLRRGGAAREDLVAGRFGEGGE